MIIVTNPYGSASNTATLAIDTTPASITSALPNQSVRQGSNVTFSVTATGAAPLSFRWQLDGVDVSGATSAILSLPGVQTNSAGTYTVIVTNLYGTDSKSATLTANLPAVITVVPATQTVPLGADVTFTVAATGTPPLSYYWRFKGIYIPGATNTTLHLSNVQFTNAGTYQAIVTNLWGPPQARSASLTVNGPPIIVDPPATQTVGAGNPLTLAVSALGTAVLRYQWQQNQADLPGATSASLTIPSFQTANEGNYRVVVSNDFGSATSAEARVMIGSTPHFGQVQLLPGSGLRLEFITLPTTNCTLQASADVTNWISLVTTNSPTGFINFTDADATNWPSRFYRGMQ
jgi:hypothetical protein